MAGRPRLNVQILLMLAFILQVALSFPTASRRKRHSDSLFTSELSKVRGRTAARNFLNSILEAQTSSTTGKVKRHLDRWDDTTHHGLTVTPQDMEEFLLAFQSPEGGDVAELLVRINDPPTEPERRQIPHPCMKWFYIYYLAKSVSSDNSSFPAAALLDRSCGTVRQLVGKLRVQGFQMLQ